MLSGGVAMMRLAVMFCLLLAGAEAALAAKPNKPVNPNPAHNAYDIVIKPRLRWSNGGGATQYLLYLGTSQNLSQDDLRGQQSGTTYDTEQLAYNTTYYWRVDAYNLEGTTRGDTWRFRTVDNTPNAPARAKTPSPATNATEVAIEPVLTWENGGDARTYEVFFGLTSSLGSGDSKGTVNDLNRVYEPGQLDYNTTYYWRIDSINPTGRTAGTVWRFKTKATAPPGGPFNPWPMDGQTNVILTGFLTWNDGGGATSYDIYFGDDSTPDSGERKPNQTGTSFYPGTLQNNKQYYWKVVARNDAEGSGGTTESPVWTFRTQAAGPALPGKATGAVPANGSTQSPLDQLLGWTAGSETLNVDVYFGTNATLGTGDLKQMFVVGNAFNPGLLQANTTYYWRIDARNDNGVTTGDKWSFTTIPAGTPPPKVTAIVPTPGIGGIPLQANLLWNASTGATGYDVYLGTTPTLGPGELRKSLNGLFYYPGGLTPQTTYYWRVDARNGYGVRTGDVWSFTTREATAALLTRTEAYLRGATTDGAGLDANGDGKIDATDLTLLVNSTHMVPAPIYPENGGFVNQPLTQFRWTPVTGATAYLFELRLNDNVGQADVVMAQQLYGPEFTLDLSLFGDALIGQNVRWSVRVSDARGEWGAWMPLAGFGYQP
jgi:hypothetical protein